MRPTLFRYYENIKIDNIKIKQEHTDLSGNLKWEKNAGRGEENSQYRKWVQVEYYYLENIMNI